jgi:hypothetical protein
MQPSNAGLALILSLLPACGGIDPVPFGPPAEHAPHAGIAGFSFDAGVFGEGGRGSSAAAGQDEHWEPLPPGDGGAGQEPTATGAAAGEGSEPSAGEGGAGGELTSNAGGGAVAASGGREAAGGATNGGRGSLSSGGGSSSAGSAAGGAAGTAGGVAGTAGGVAGTAGGVAGGGSAGTTSGPPLPVLGELAFSEYVEGSSSYKALELRATTTVSLVGCALATYSNGAESPRNSIALDGTLAAGEVAVLCSSSLATLLGDVCDRTEALDFNGNDAVALDCGGVTLDVLGVVGSDPKTGWSGEGASTLNQTLRRRCGAGPDANPTDAFDPALEWLALPVDTFDGLGDPSCG